MSEDSEDLEKKRKRQTDENHAALGRYVEAFEQLVMWMRSSCTTLACLHARTSSSAKHQRLMNVVFFHKSMTADNLFSIYRSMVGEIVRDGDYRYDNQEKKAIAGVLGYFSNRFQGVTNTRNDYIHAAWFIGHSNTASDDWSAISFMRGKSTSDGLKFLDGPKNATEIDEATRECGELRDYLLRFHGCFIAGRYASGFRVTDHFVKIKKGEWQPKKQDT